MGVTLDPEQAEFHTSGYTAGLDYNLLLRTVISYKQGSESSLGLLYHSSFVSLGENNSAIIHIDVGVHYVLYIGALCINFLINIHTHCGSWNKTPIINSDYLFSVHHLLCTFYLLGFLYTFNSYNNPAT